MKVFLCVLTLLSLCVGHSSAIAGGGSVGSGSDGLFVNKSDLRKDVDISLPIELANAGQLLVSGELGAGQAAHKVVAFKVELDKSAHPGGLDGRSEGLVNQPIGLRPGLYKVLFGNGESISNFNVAEGLIEIKNDETTHLELRKIRLPHSIIPATYSVFIDYTKRQMQNRLVEVVVPIWQDTLEIGIYRSWQWACKNGNCFDLFKAIDGDFESYFKVLHFGEDGTFSLPSIVKNETEALWSRNGIWMTWNDANRIFLSTPQSEGFVSVFPGTYGIVFTAQDKRASVSYGIEVN
jgi:hypothetical protein